MITLSDLHAGPRKVRHDDGPVFMLSAVELELDRKGIGAYALAPYRVGDNPSPRRKHRLIDHTTRADWFARLTLVQ